MRASRFIFVWRKTEIRVREGSDPPDPPGIRWGGPRPGDPLLSGAVVEGIFGEADERCLFCVCESRLSHPLTNFFFRPTGGELRQFNAMLRVTLMSSLHDNGDRSVQLPCWR